MRSDRLIFVDIVRGLAIIGVIVVHSTSYGIWYNEHNALKVLPPGAVAALSPIILLATWAGAFALITGLVNAYNIHRRLERGRGLAAVCREPAVNAAVLMGIWILVALLFTHRRPALFGAEGEIFSLVSGSLAQGRFTPPDWETLFYKDALVMIALAGFTSALAMRLLYRNVDPKDSADLRRRAWIGLSAGAVFLAASAVLQPPLYVLFERLMGSGGAGNRIAAWFVNLLSGPSHVLLPYGGFAVTGASLGVLLAAGTDRRGLRRPSLSFGIAYLATSAVFLARTVSTALQNGTDPLVAVFDYAVITPGLSFFAIGSILCLFPMVVRLTDDRPAAERDRLFRKTLWLRRFGMISLSVFILENPVTAILGRIFHLVFGNPDAPTDAFMTNAFAIILYFVVTLAFWFAVVRLWEKKGFRCSFEWLSIRIGGKFRGRPSDRLNVERILYGRSAADS